MRSQKLPQRRDPVDEHLVAVGGVPRAMLEVRERHGQLLVGLLRHEVAAVVAQVDIRARTTTLYCLQSRASESNTPAGSVPTSCS